MGGQKYIADHFLLPSSPLGGNSDAISCHFGVRLLPQTEEVNRNLLVL